MFNRIPPVFALVAALVAAPATAHAADESGAEGYVSAVQINNTSADAYLQYHGRLFVRVSKQVVDEYRWGGTSCGSKIVNEAQLSALNLALANGMKVAPSWRPGQGQTKCLVGFVLQG